jgi:hypothetical protein
MFSKRSVVWLAAFVIALFAVAGREHSASAATIGQALTDTVCAATSEGGFHVVQVTSSGPDYVIPEDGTLTSWSVEAIASGEGESPTTVTAHLEVWRLELDGSYTLIFMSPGEDIEVDSGVHVIPLTPAVPVTADDIIGLGLSTGNGGCIQASGEVGDSVATFTGALSEGFNSDTDNQEPSTLSQFQVNVAANFVTGEPTPGMITLVKSCVSDAGTAVEFDSLPIDVNVEFDPEVVLSPTEDADELFDSTAVLDCGTDTMLDMTDLFDLLDCNFDQDPGCGVPEFADALITLTEELPAGVTAVFGGDCPENGVLDIVDNPGGAAVEPLSDLGVQLLDEGLVCTIDNTFDLPDLTVTKVCPSGNSTPPATFAIALSEVAGTTPIACGETVVLGNVPVGDLMIGESITGTAVFASAIACGGVSGVAGTTTTVTTSFGADIICTLVNALDTNAGDGIPPIPPIILPGDGGFGPIIITVPLTVNNTNTNTNTNVIANDNDSTNTNTNTNPNTNTMSQSNVQDQTATGSGAVLGQGGVPGVVAGVRVTPPSTGDGGLAASLPRN